MSEDYTTSDEGARSALPPPPLPPLPPAAAFAKPPKSAAAATLLSLFPGLGQIYNGQPAKALVFFLGFAGSIAAAHDGAEMPFALFIPFIYFYNMIDAWRSAAQINARAAGGVPLPEEGGAESPAWGAALVALGLVLLAKNLGWISLAAVARYWPVLLIVAGAALLRGSLGQKRESASGGL